MSITAQPPDGVEGAILIRTGQLRESYGGVSDTWVDRRLASDPNFPKPCYIGKRRFWKLAELEKYERDLARSPAPVQAV